MNWLTPVQLAERLAVTVGTLANWRSASTPEAPVGPPFVKMGRRVRYEEQAVTDWQRSLSEAAAS